MKKIIKSFLCMMVFSLPILAGNSARIGTAGATELLIPVGAKGLSLGGANVALASGVDAIFWNPAGMTKMSNSSVETMFSQMNYIADIGVSYGAVNIVAGDFGNIGFSIKSLSFGDISRTTEDFPDGTGEIFSPSYIHGGVSYSKMLNDHVSIGATLNLISEKIMSVSANGFGINAGVQYHGLGIPELMLGIVAKNIGPNMKFDGSNLYRNAYAPDALRPQQYYKVEAASFELPTTMEIGLAYEKKFDEQNRVMIAANFQNNNYQEDEYKFGGEYSYNNMVFVRGGYNLSPDVEKSTDYLYDYTFGVGLNLDLSGTVVMFDYAYRNVTRTGFSANNVVTVTLGF